ncbi:efflux RND transporter periplasmic adaptor subunit [Cupriavidus pinatubonensis]|uniref:Multidrug resistance protein MexA n=1 Tax=Cupriavidus pinatubonensis TaxID=248026 RepID=A0ABN7YTV3_9BURK|nr:efflux RND transporter periplasmic adaptor subunit [Cupriavidus pinatubonensis]CAG9175710.1 Multidrug resistance protein MexA [Cupriavidus pinatubonensis]
MQRSRGCRAWGPVTLAIALSTLAGCGGKKEAAAPPPPQVSVVTLKTEAVTLDTSLPGRTTAYRIAEVRPQVDGIILRRLFKEGSDVTQGQQLYQIDPSTYDATYKSARATMESSRLLAQRYGRLVGDEAVSKQQYDEAKAAWQQAQATLDRAEINLRYTKVLAPISGRIGRSSVTEGALVTNGQAAALAVVQQLDPIYVDVTQPSASLLRLRRELANGALQSAGTNAAQVNLVLEDGTKYPETGRLEFSEVAVDQGTGSVTLRAVFPNPRHELLPGMFVHARLREGVKTDGLLVPQQGVTRDLKGQATALVVNAKDEVELRQIRTDRAIGDKWLVADGLKAGDRVIVEGVQFVKPGAKVRVAQADSGTGNPPAAAGASAAVAAKP